MAWKVELAKSAVAELDKLDPQVVGRMSAALSDMEVSEGAALFRPTKTATFFGSGSSGLEILQHVKEFAARYAHE